MRSEPPGPQISADEALARLIAGNERFFRRRAVHKTIERETLADLAGGQSPFATILGCSDSRVPPEHIFDAGLGELFVIRVAGNVYSAEIAASLQYAGAHLRTPLFLVLGHEGCGAVKAALDEGHHDPAHHAYIAILVNRILPAIEGIDPTVPPAEQLARAVERNVRWTVRQICATPEARARLAGGQARVVGAVYELESGRVRLLPAEA